MPCLIDYLQLETRSFEERALSSVDAVILTTAAYLNVAPIPEAKKSPSDAGLMTIAKLCSSYSIQELLQGTWLTLVDEGEAFVKALGASKRFGSLQLCNYQRVFNVDEATQFDALCFLLPENASFIALRGTDSSFAGWKEDFAFLMPGTVPAQDAALAYLNKVSEELCGPLYIGGHSKGGNLAAYAAHMCSDEIFNRILRVYSHDGPGLGSLDSEEGYALSLQGKLEKIVPDTSIFGLLLEHHPSYQVVRTGQPILKSHNPLCWKMLSTDFYYQKDVDPLCKRFSEGVNTWADKASVHEKEQLLASIYHLFDSSKANSVTEFAQDAPRHFSDLFKAASQLDDETKNTALTSLAEVFDLMTDDTSLGFLRNSFRRFTNKTKPNSNI